MTQETASYDLVVFGATGFVGNLVCKYLLEQVGVGGEVSWAIAGRSRTKLERLSMSLGSQAAALPIVIADATDEATLRSLCAQTRVVISTVGPYALRGEPLVKICAATGTDYCDLTGEVQWIRRMIQHYEHQAQQSGARIIHCCGFDSVPSDLGVYYLQQQAKQRFGQACSRVKNRFKDGRGGVSGGTIASGINLMKEAFDDPTLRQDLTNPYSLCPGAKANPDQSSPLIEVQHDDDFQAWIAPFVMAAVNTPIVLRSQMLLTYVDNSEFQYDEAILTNDGMAGWAIAQGVSLGLSGFGLAAALPPTRWVLENAIVPASGEGPSLEEQEQGFYDLRFWGETADGQTLQTKVTGDRDPGYGSTSRILGQVGLCLAQDFPKSAKAGGFWTPAAMFGEVMIDRLSRYAGVTFEVLP